jgi:hypothetical protein
LGGGRRGRGTCGVEEGLTHVRVVIHQALEAAKKGEAGAHERLQKAQGNAKAAVGHPKPHTYILTHTQTQGWSGGLLSSSQVLYVGCRRGRWEGCRRRRGLWARSLAGCARAWRRRVRRRAGLRRLTVPRRPPRSRR